MRRAWLILALVPLLGGCVVPNESFLPADGGPAAGDDLGGAPPTTISQPTGPDAAPPPTPKNTPGSTGTKGKVKCGSLLCDVLTEECCRRDGAKAKCVEPGTCPGGM